MNAKHLFCSLAVCLYLTCLTASAQEVVHALEGTVSGINQPPGTLFVQINDGTSGSFNTLPEKRAESDVDKDLRAEIVPAGKFTTKGDQVVLLYEGYGNDRSAVAVHDLGSSALNRSVGTVQHYDRHQHLLTLKTNDGKTAAFLITDKTIADTPTGAAEGMKFDPSKGDHVQVAARTDNTGKAGSLIALYVGLAD